MGNAAFERITSRTNPTVVMLSKLKDRKNREAGNLCLAEGVKLSREALKNCRPVYAVLSESAERRGGMAAETAEQAVSLGARGYLVTDEVFAKICTEQSPQGVLLAVEPSGIAETVAPGEEPGRAEAWQSERLMFLSDVRDPGNLGAVMRSAEAFGIDRLILSGCADCLGPKTLRASMGAAFRLPTAICERPAEMIISLRTTGRRVIAAALTGESMILGAEPVHSSDVFVIGNEGHGLSEELIRSCSGTVRIPMAPETESLNAAMAATVLLWEVCRGR